MDRKGIEPLWTRPYVLTMISMAMIFIPYSLVQSILPIYIMQGLGGSSQLAGLSNSVFAIACILFRMHTPWLETKLGIRTTIKVSAFLFLISFMCLLVTKSIPVILAIRFLSGICYAIANTALMSVGIRFIPRTRKNEGIAYLTTVYMVGWAIGPFIGVHILQVWTYQWLFVFCGVAFMPAMLLISSINTNGLKTEIESKRKKFSIHYYFETKILLLCGAALVLTAAYASVVSFVVAYAKSINLLVVSAYYFALMACLAVVSRLCSGVISKIIGERALITLSYATFALGMFLLSIARSSVLMLVSGTLIGIATGFITPSLQAIAVRNSPDHRTSIVSATYMTFMDIGSGIGSFIVGLSIPIFGYSHIYMAISPIVLVVPIGLFWIYIRRFSRNALNA